MVLCVIKKLTENKYIAETKRPTTRTYIHALDYTIIIAVPDVEIIVARPFRQPKSSSIS